MKEVNVLIVEDHPIIVDSYKLAMKELERENKEISFTIDFANTIDKALDYLQKDTIYNLVFLDIRLPPSKDEKYLSGEDLGVDIPKLQPEAELMVISTLNDNYRIYNILNNVNPLAFLVKNDISLEELKNAITSILDKKPFYSKSVLQSMRRSFSQNIALDATDRKILYELSLGTLTKDLPDAVLLSIGAIEKRKRNLKALFNLESSSDKELIEEAKKKGFI